MSGTERDRFLDHDYDGIREYDNPLPGWWVWLFVATIVFSVFYGIYYHFGHGPSILDEYNADMLALGELQSREALKAGPISDQTILDLAKNQSMMLGAGQAFGTRCAPCHGASGEGKIGPNLTDDYWLHGGRPTDIHKAISEGIPAKGMISWKSQLRPEEILALAAYVVGPLHGTDPPGAKAAEGVKFESVAVAAESSAAGGHAGKP